MPEPITGSKLPIARHCTWWAREDVSYPKRERSDAASNGVRMHDAFSSYIEHKVFPPLSPEQRVLADNMKVFWGQRALSSGWETEVSYALDAANFRARRLGKHLNREYGELAPGEIALTNDYQWIEAGAVALTGDWKTGYGAHVEDPDENLQLLSAGAALAASTGSEGCQLEIAHVVADGVYPRRYFATPLVLHRAMHEIASIQKRIPDSLAKAGDHCRWCPALGACPETQRQLAEVATARGTSAPVVWSKEYVSDENDALLVDELASVKKFIEQVEDSLKERAGKRGGIRLNDGKLYKAVVCRKESLDKGLVMEILGEKYAKCTKIIEYEQFKRVKA